MNISWTQMDALMDLNNFTEHRFGLGPLDDSYHGDKKLIRRALRLAKKNGYEVDNLDATLLG